MVDCSKILPNLFLGSKEVPCTYLLKHNITVSICVAPEEEVPEMIDIIFYRFPVSFLTSDQVSRENMYKARDKCIELMNEGNKVFLHCVLGYNRSPAIAAMVQSKLYDISIEDAVMHIKRLRTIAPEKHLALLK